MRNGLKNIKKSKRKKKTAKNVTGLERLNAFIAGISQNVVNAAALAKKTHHENCMISKCFTMKKR